MYRENLQVTGTHLSKVILLRDAFSEETVANGIRIQVPGQNKKPVMKPGGYCLFLDMGQEEFEIEVLSAVYQRRRVRLVPDRGEEPEEIFLYPSSAYPVKSGTVMVQGTVRPGMSLDFHMEKGVPECRLIQDCQKGDTEISIFIKEGIGARRNWYIRDKEKQTGEYLRIKESAAELQRSGLQMPLRNSYRKKDTAIYPSYACIADEEGSFCLLLRYPEISGCRLYYSCMDEGKEFCGELEFHEGKRIRLAEEGLEWECV